MLACGNIIIPAVIVAIRNTAQGGDSRQSKFTGNANIPPPISSCLFNKNGPALNFKAGPQYCFTDLTPMSLLYKQHSLGIGVVVLSDYVKLVVVNAAGKL